MTVLTPRAGGNFSVVSAQMPSGGSVAGCTGTAGGVAGGVPAISRRGRHPDVPGHVGLVIGGGKMIEAYATGFPIRVATYTNRDPIGFTRPWANANVVQAAGNVLAISGIIPRAAADV